MTLSTTRKILITKAVGFKTLNVGDIRMLADVLNEQNVPDETPLKHADLGAIGIEFEY